MTKRTITVLLISLLLYPQGAETATVPPIPPVIQQALINAGIDAAAAAKEWEFIYTTLTTFTGWYEAIPAEHWLRGGTPAKLLADSGTIHSGIVDVINKCRALAEASGQPIQTFLRNPATWGGESAAVNFRLLLTAAAVVVTAAVSFAASYFVSMEYHEAKMAMFEAEAKEDGAFQNALGMIYEGLQAGRIELQPGFELEDAIRLIKVNMETGRPPFTGVLHRRPCPSITGTWTGELQIKEVRGESNIKVGTDRTLRPNMFVISQDENDPCTVKLKMGNNEISGFLARSITPVTRVSGTEVEREEQDVFVLDADSVGSLKRAELTLYGIGSGLLRGNLKVELEQQAPNGSVIVSGGILERL